MKIEVGKTKVVWTCPSGVKYYGTITHILPKQVIGTETVRVQWDNKSMGSSIEDLGENGAELA